MGESLWHPRHGRLTFSATQCVGLSWIIAFSVFLAVSLLGGCHAYLVLTNQTTIEFHARWSKRREERQSGRRYRSAYDMGCRRNFQQVFGHGPWDVRWLVPYASKGPAGDGTGFP